MNQKVSAGLLIRHKGAWTVPKGGIDPGETPFEAAVREFVEETGFDPCGPYLALGSVTQRSGKIVHVWAFEGDCDPDRVTSTTTTMEWPPRSGKRIQIPEIDRVAFFSLEEAHLVINVAQGELLDRLVGLAPDANPPDAGADDRDRSRPGHTPPGRTVPPLSE
jgi:predicted NUDIX family NTP pyrophosphohydrolase